MKDYLLNFKIGVDNHLYTYSYLLTCKSYMRVLCLHYYHMYACKFCKIWSAYKHACNFHVLYARNERTIACKIFKQNPMSMRIS